MNVILLTLSLALLSKFVAFSWVIGSVSAFFSAINVMGPLVVVFGGLPGGLIYLALNFCFKTKTIFLLASTGVPNLLAGWYWRLNSKLIKILLPCLSMGLFWYQTWGTLAAWYAALWFIPVLIAVFNFNNLFAKSLAATWMAHAVGSILWLYFGNISAQSWLYIMPIAILERTCLAVLMAIMYQAVKTMSKYKMPKLFNNLLLSLKRAS